MITVSQIRDGSGYLKNHLSSNDYYSENETVVGQWHGKAAGLLGLEGKTVGEDDFQALRINRHPGTGEKLRPRKAKVAFHDFVISAPKSVSIAAMVEGDERVVEAFDRCAMQAFERLESYAAVRVRAGESYHTEELRRTGNAVAAVFRHDASRLLDPQIHSHLVFANLSYDETSEKWLALQPKEMAEQSKEWIRAIFYRELAEECRGLGYAVEKEGEAFRLSGIDRGTEHSFSQRTLQREKFESRFQDHFGEAPSKRRIEQFIKDHKAAAVKRFKNEHEARFGNSPSSEVVSDFVKDWRSSKMAKATTEEVHALQQSRMTGEQSDALKTVVQQAREKAGDQISPKQNSNEDQKAKAEGLVETKKIDHALSTSTQETKKKRHEAISRRKSDRLKTMRRVKKSVSMASVMRGNPTLQLGRRLQQLARKKSHGTQR